MKPGTYGESIEQAKPLVLLTITRWLTVKPLVVSGWDHKQDEQTLEPPGVECQA